VGQIVLELVLVLAFLRPHSAWFEYEDEFEDENLLRPTLVIRDVFARDERDRDLGYLALGRVATQNRVANLNRTAA